MTDSNKIIAQFKLILNAYSDELDNAIFNFFREQLSIVKTRSFFYDAILECEELHQYAENAIFSPLWDQAIKTIKLGKDKNDNYIPLLPQKKLPSYHLIMGFYIFHIKIDYDNIESKKSQLFLDLAVNRYHSFPCLNLKLKYLLEENRLRKKDPLLCNRLIDETNALLPYHGAAGYLLSAFICHLFSEIDPDLIKIGFGFLTMAQKMESESQNELNNCFLGGKLFDQFDNIGEIYEHFITTYNISPSDRRDTHESVNRAFMSMH